MDRDDRAAAPRADRAPADHVCDRCDAPMVEHHCKIVCPNCGMMRDCSDP